MTQKKLEIIGPYTPDYKGPFCVDDEYNTPVELKIRDGRGGYPLRGYIGNNELLNSWTIQGISNAYRLMNAREVPVAREFWVNEYERSNGDGTWFGTFTNKEIASINKTDSFIRTIHVREVLPENDQ